MKLINTLILACLMGLAATSAQALVRIANDNGGQIGPYSDRYRTLARSGEQVIIDGLCLSACTLVTGFVPRERICVTARARLGFHAAWAPGQGGRPVFSRAGTQLLMKTYPVLIRGWIGKRGGLTAKMIYLQGGELRAFYQPCTQQQIAALH